MNATMNGNGKARKSLADQIDRLDAVLDGLADNLNQAIAAAVKEAVSLAVCQALTEILNQPRLLAQLQATAQANVHPRPAQVEVVDQQGSAKQTVRRLWAGVRKAAQATANGCRRVVLGTLSSIASLVQAVIASCRHAVNKVRQAVASVSERTRQAGATLLRQAVRLGVRGWDRLQIVRQLRVQLLAALAIGLLAGTTAYLAEPVIAGVASGVGSFALAILLQAWLLVRRLAAVVAGD